MAGKEGFELECRLAVIEYFIQRLYAAHLAKTPDPLASVDILEKQWNEGFSKQTFSALDPVQSDLVAAELQEQANRILEGIRELLEKRGQ